MFGTLECLEKSFNEHKKMENRVSEQNKKWKKKNVKGKQVSSPLHADQKSLNDFFMTDKGFSLHSFSTIFLYYYCYCYSLPFIHIDFIDVWFEIASAASSDSIDVRMKLIFIACSRSYSTDIHTGNGIFMDISHSYFTYLSR